MIDLVVLAVMVMSADVSAVIVRRESREKHSAHNHAVTSLSAPRRLCMLTVAVERITSNKKENTSSSVCVICLG